MKKKVLQIKRDPLDFEFRDYTKQLINSARKKIRVMTGEFSIYYFSDVEDAFRDAINRGVSVQAYLGKCDTDTINRVVSDGMTAYVGNRKLQDHYIVADNYHWIVSEKHKPYSIGRRHGTYVKNDQEGAEKILAQFDSLTKNMRPITKPNLKQDPLPKIVKQLY